MKRRDDVGPTHTLLGVGDIDFVCYRAEYKHLAAGHDKEVGVKSFKIYVKYRNIQSSASSLIISLSLSLSLF